MAQRELVVKVIGDSKSLERAMARSSKAATGFGRTAETAATRVDRSAKRFSGFATGAFAGFAGAEVLSLVARQVGHVVSVAAEAQQVLGQTRVALETTGQSWAQYGSQIEETVAAQSRFGFDDEALMQSFSLFIRSTDSVSEALKRNQLAMDVSRARFISLEQAALIVNKAALGQSGALRRLGINVAKNATAVELLTALQEKYGGAAEAAGDDAATAMDRFKVSAENAQESVGTLLLPAVSSLAGSLATAADDASRLIGVLQRLGKVRIPVINVPLKIGGREIGGGARVGGIIGDALKRAVVGVVPGGQQLGQLRGALQALPEEAKKAGLDAGRTAGDSFRTALREHLDLKNFKIAPLFTVQQRNTWFDAAIGRREDRVQDIRTAKGQLKELDRIAAAIRARRANTSDTTRLLTLEDKLLGVLRQRRTIEEQIAAKARQHAQAVRERTQARVGRRNEVFDAGITRRLDRLQDVSLRKQLAGLRQIAAAIRQRMAATRDLTRRLNLEDSLLSVLRQQKDVQTEITDQIRAANQALKDRAEAIKSAVIERLQRKQTDILNRRALEEAKEQLRIARQSGGPKGIEAARRAVSDVELEMRIAKFERAPARLTAGGQFALGGITINVHGVTDPEAVADKVTRIIQRRAGRTAARKRGRS